MLIFISGGVRSGKSRVAEQFVIEGEIPPNRCIYLATSRITDGEMKERVNRHQCDRDEAQVQWMTYEQSTEIGSLLGEFQVDDVVLLDCLTNWLANELFVEHMNWDNEQEQGELVENMLDTIVQLNKRVAKLVVVSNDLFEAGVVNGATYVYMKLLGGLHQHIVAQSEIALSVEAGITCYKKGEGLF
ncbi:bifunctional adenosylcobinamide kinase/adenosylcobinamide-phosphate guanylyltransferase [Bacillus sp. CGMCC 1.16541]|uniref:bifunctional adenosylcobinamide kinase/adenosylcobinamide-phosphate guanylyltransferase n=1 Tax=Bacillus sp. CGMCC 1.16541 TaxID=2185143 RepID=UPI000D73D2DC|nr:bifunctional adenosylcobinamide kinase/adenosylcobinamide-phosphate guanylyltransferase [Bacillus sp. CGMCC 1.16541]